jgi:hypothetical protein
VAGTVGRHGRFEGIGGTSETPAHAWRRRTLRGAASSVGQIAPLIGLQRKDESDAPDHLRVHGPLRSEWIAAIAASKEG